MKTLFATGWQRDLWTPRMGQDDAAVDNGFDWSSFFGGLAKVPTSYLEQETAEEQRKRKEAEVEALRIQQQTLQAQAGKTEKIFGVSPTTALVIGGLGLAAVIGIVMVAK